MQSLERKLLLIMVLVTLTATGVGSFLVAGYQADQLRTATQRRMSEIAQIVSGAVEDSMVLNRPEVTRRLLNSQHNLGGLESVAVFDGQGREVFYGESRSEDGRVARLHAKAEPFVVNEPDRMLIYSPLVNGSRCDGCHTEHGLLGAVRVSASLAPDNLALSRVRLGGAMGAVLISILVSLLSWVLLRRTVVGPVARIEAAATRMADGDLASPIEPDARDEIGRTAVALGAGLSAISGTLQQVRDVVGQAADVAREFSGEAKALLEATQMETESFERITGAMEAFRASADGIGGRTGGLVQAADEAKAAIDDMTDRVERISRSSAALFGAVEDITRSTRQVSSSAETIERSTEGLQHQADETMRTIELISEASKDIERRTGESADLSRRVMHEASTVGMQSVGETIDGMEEIRRSAEATSAYITRLGARSQEIAAILAVIDEITNQTSLLALNAAIIAAQAGEHGRGFAVVADEIKELADRAGASTQEIAELVANVRQEVDDAVRGVTGLTAAVDQGIARSSGAARALEEIVSTAQTSSETSASVRERIALQARAAETARRAMEDVRAEVRRIAGATAVQARDTAALEASARDVHRVATSVRAATEEQATQGGTIRSQTDSVHDGAREIASLVAGQRRGAEEMSALLHDLAALPERNRELSVRIDHALRALAEATTADAEKMARFRLEGDER